MSGSMLEYTIRQHADNQTVTATLTGEWDLQSDKALITELHGLIERDGIRNVIIDATGLTFCDSSCLGAFVSLHQASTARGGWLRVAAPPDTVRRPLVLTGLDQVFDVTDSVAGASDPPP
jgi:anti-anti-sigma factor